MLRRGGKKTYENAQAACGRTIKNTRLRAPANTRKSKCRCEKIDFFCCSYRAMPTKESHKTEENMIFAANNTPAGPEENA